jgi:Flp pilus assembly protein TadB
VVSAARRQSRDRSEAARRLEDNARVKRGNDALVRVCIIAFGLAIAAILPVSWEWRIGLFLAIMFMVGILIPAVGRARKRPS